MTHRRWIADEVSGDRAALTGEHARHLAQALRAKLGQQFDIVTGDSIRRGQVIAIEAGRVEFALGEVIAAPPEAAITVVMSIFKFDRMEWAIEKCTELGVARIVPVIAARTERHLAAAAGKRVERWDRIAHVAAEQSRRTSPPEITLPAQLKEVLKHATNKRIVLSEIEASVSLKDAISRPSPSLTLALGPEGGWKDEELDAFKASGWLSASLGVTILRAETAAIAAVAIATSILQG